MTDTPAATPAAPTTPPADVPASAPAWLKAELTGEPEPIEQKPELGVMPAWAKEAVQAESDSPKPDAKPELKTFELKVNGQVYGVNEEQLVALTELSVDEVRQFPDAAARVARMVLAANDRLDGVKGELAKARNIEQVFSMTGDLLKSGDHAKVAHVIDTLTGPGSFSKLAIDHVSALQEFLSMSDAERQTMERDRELTRLRGERDQFEQQQRQQQQSAHDAQQDQLAAQRINAEATPAMDRAGLPRTPGVVREFMRVWANVIQSGNTAITADQVAVYVKRHLEELKALPDLSRLGDDELSKLGLAKAKPTPATTRPEFVPTKSGQKKTRSAKPKRANWDSDWTFYRNNQLVETR